MKLFMFLNRILGYFYYYRVQYTYKNKSGHIVFSWNADVGVTGKKYFRQHKGIRDIKTASVNNPEVMNLLKPHLCNGTLHMEPICYLGYYK